MNDKDQKLLWEAYLEKHAPSHKKDEDNDKEKGKYDDNDGEDERCDYVPCKEDVQEEGERGVANAASEGMGLSIPEFSAIDRENPEQMVFQMVFDAILGWMRADSEGHVTPGDMEGYNMSTAFDDAKESIRSALQDISFSEVKAHLNNTVDMRAGEDDIRRDDSRLSDMPPREPGS